MPIHDWTRVDAGLFHAFQQLWIATVSRALNQGVLPTDYYALPEQSIPDDLTLKLSPGPNAPNVAGAGLAVAGAPPRTRVARCAEERRHR
jgi:hypothetical protein